MSVKKCEKCGMVFTRKANYTRHIKSTNPCTAGEPLFLKYENLELNYNNILAELNTIKKENTELTNKLKKLRPKNKSCELAPFGKEDLSFIDEAMRQNLLEQDCACIQYFFKLVHNNDDKPEYKNVYMSNIRDKKHSVAYNGDKWTVEFTSNIVEAISKRRIEYMQNLYNTLSNEDKQKFGSLTNFIRDYKNDANQETLRSNFILLLYNANDRSSRKIPGK